MKVMRDESGFHVVEALIIVTVLAVIGFVGWRVVKSKDSSGSSSSSSSKTSEVKPDKAVEAGKSLTGSKCEGTGEATFTHLPMNANDFSVLIPYGLMIGGHVTPIDHQYFSPTIFNSPRDKYPVYAMADATITDIQQRITDRGVEYRLIFAHSCTFLYYYDLVTSLTGKTKEAYESKNVNLKVKAGEQIGAIGGQTLDFAVWNTKRTLSGFVNPDSYKGEAWKIYVDNPSPYYTPALRKIVEAKNPRVAKPTEGKIDYDVDGKLIGNWFEKGTGGYSGNSRGGDPNYSKTHLAFAPDLYDPSHFIISIGSLYASHPNNMQHATLTNSPNPKDVGTKTGIVKYNLVDWFYTKNDGSTWDRMSTAKGIKLQPTSSMIFGCAIAQLVDKGTLKFEVFPGKSCSDVSGFDSAAKTYTR